MNTLICTGFVACGFLKTSKNAMVMTKGSSSHSTLVQSFLFTIEFDVDALSSASKKVGIKFHTLHTISKLLTSLGSYLKPLKVLLHY